MTYKLSDFDYHLPEELIVQEPARPRDHARLLVYNRQTGAVSDDYFYNLNLYLPDSATLVANNSKVEKCRLLFDNGSKEIFILNRLNDRVAEALVRPGRKFRKGRVVTLAEGLEAKVM
ncbi:MAG: S-adenosylmethionine:tRNA ribosyltransferase-isomerase, partial [Balneolaceae bacterium]